MLFPLSDPFYVIMLQLTAVLLNIGVFSLSAAICNIMTFPLYVAI